MAKDEFLRVEDESIIKKGLTGSITATHNVQRPLSGPLTNAPKLREHVGRTSWAN